MWQARLTAFVLALFFLFPAALSATAEDTTEFEREGEKNTQFEVDLLPGRSAKEPKEYNITFNMAAVSGEDVLNGNFTVAPVHDGQYSERLKIDMNNFSSSLDWVFGGPGYGAFGYQSVFSDDRTSQSLTFEEGGGTDSTSVKLPYGDNFDVLSDPAPALEVWGRPAGIDEFEDSQLASIRTSRGSNSLQPYNAIDGDGNLHVVWTDNGDPVTERTGSYRVLYRSCDAPCSSRDDWNDIQDLSGGISGTPYASIAAAGNTLYVVWYTYEYNSETGRWEYPVRMAKSTDNGENWGASKRISQYYSSRTSSAYRPIVTANSDDVHVAWWSYWENDTDENNKYYEYDIFFRHSDDGGSNWGDEKEISWDEYNGTRYAYDPDMFYVSGDLYIVWRDNNNYTENDTTDYDVFLVYSADEGENWSRIKEVSPGTDTVYYPTVAADASGAVHITYLEYNYTEANGSGYLLRYAKSTDYGDNWTIKTLSQLESYLYFPDVTLAGSYVYVAFDPYSPDGMRNNATLLKVSGNGGANWGANKTLDNGGYSTLRERVRLTVDTAGRLWAVWTDREEQKLGDNLADYAGFDSDIWARRTNVGATSMADPTVVSDIHIEAQSYAPALDSDDEGNLYMVYWDDGSLDGNGNNYNGEDGDWFFARSDDYGQTWQDRQTVTNRKFDNRQNSYSFGYSARIAAAGNGVVHVAYLEYDYRNASGQNLYKLFVSSSQDYGATWGEPVKVANNTSSSYLYTLDVAADGTNGVIVWRNWKSGEGYRNYYSYTDNSGGDWSEPELLVDSTYYGSYMTVDMSGDNAAVVWYYSGYVLYYVTSTDSGQSWSDLQSISTNYYPYYPAVAVEDDSIYVAYRSREKCSSDNIDDINFMKSEDFGESWETPKCISPEPSTSHTNYYPDIAVSDGLIYVAWGRYNYSGSKTYYDVFVSVSPDDGESWTEGILLSDGYENDYVYVSARPGVAIGYDDRATVAWSDRFNMWNHYQIWTRTTKEPQYPTNPYIDIGADGVYEWEWVGEFTKDDSPQEISASALRTGFNDGADAATKTADSYEIPLAEVNIEGGSDSAGRLVLRDLALYYDVELMVDNQDVLQGIKSKSKSAKTNEKERVDVTVALWAEQETTVTLDNLLVTTADSDLTITEIETSEPNPEEGFDMSITVTVLNEGDGDADMDIVVWHVPAGTSEEPNEDNRIKTVPLSEVPKNGGEKNVSLPWRSMPAGNWDVYARIIKESPKDVDPDNGNEDFIGVNVAATHSDVVIDYNLVSTPAYEGDVEVDVEIFLDNTDGKKAGTVELKLYEESVGSANLVDTLTVNVARQSSTTEYLNWNVTNVTQLVLKATDLNEGDVSPPPLKVDVITLPNFVVKEVSWTPQAITEDTRVDFKLKWTNTGEFNVTATVRLDLFKGTRNKNIIFAAKENFQGGQTKSFTGTVTFDKLTEGVFGSLDGSYQIYTSIGNVEKSTDMPDDILPAGLFFEGPEDLFFEYAEPPDVNVDNVVVGDEYESGGEIQVSALLSNTGGTPVSGVLKLYIILEGTVQGSNPQAQTNFSLDGYSSKDVSITWFIPKAYDGNYKFRFIAEDMDPREGSKANPTNTMDREGVEILGPDDPIIVDPKPPYILFAVIGIVLIGGIGGGLFFIKSSAGGLPKAPAGVRPPGAPGTPAPLPGAPSAAAGAPAAGAAGQAAGGGGPATSAAPQAVTLPCPNCSTNLKITSAQRPIVVACPSCSTKLKLEH